MQQTGGSALARQLVHEGVTDLFALPGIQLDWAMDGLRQCQDQIRVLVPRHEQAVAYMADGYARTTGRVGACMVVPGPGVLNAMAGLATAYACNSRVMCIAGDINSACRGQGRGLMHEVNGQTEILQKVTKWQGLPRGRRDIPAVIHQAMEMASSGAPRPVAVEMPQDLLNVVDDIPLVTAPAATPGLNQPDPSTIEAAAKLLDHAAFPVIYAGGGTLAGNATAALTALAERLDAPIVTSENGRGVVSDRHPLVVNTLAGRALFEHADVVLVVGSRFLNSGSGLPAWSSDGLRYIYINLDPSASKPPHRAEVAIEADAAAGVSALAAAVRRRFAGTAERLRLVRAWAQAQIDLIEPQASWVRALRSALPDDGFLVNELTQVGYLARAAFPVYLPNTFITAGYQETLGAGFPIALGIAAAHPGRAIVSINGDGGFGYNMQELATARKYGLNVAVVIFNDGQFGNVSAVQKQQFGAEFGTDLCNPSFAALAAAFGVPHATATSPAHLEALLRSSFGGTGPTVIEVPLGELPSPWHLLRLQKVPFAKAPRAAPPNPLGQRQPTA